LIRRLLLAAPLALLLQALAQAQEPERAPFITTPQDVVEAMLRFAGTGPSDVVVDLGSGDGRIVIAAARKFGARAIGIELDPPLVRKSREAAAAAGVAGRATFVEGNVLFADISQATVVTIYLLPGLINQLQPRFLEELLPGTRVVSHAFAMTGWQPDRSEAVHLQREHAGQGMESRLFLWVVPAKARGVWESGGRSENLELRISQNFQQIEVELGKTPAKRATLEGKNISWETGDARFEGVVEGASIRGELARNGQKKSVVFEKR
jgi:precorrin-6B methylase 2